MNPEINKLIHNLLWFSVFAIVLTIVWMLFDMSFKNNLSLGRLILSIYMGFGVFGILYSVGISDYWNNISTTNPFVWLIFSEIAVIFTLWALYNKAGFVAFGWSLFGLFLFAVFLGRELKNRFQFATRQRTE